MRFPAKWLVIALTACCAQIALADTAQKETVIPEQVLKQMRGNGECRDFDANHMKKMREIAQLSENETLFLLPCFTGAYNVIYHVFVFDRRYPDDVKPSVFAAFSDELGWYGQDQLINAWYDEATRTLTAIEKSRGLGDCGSQPSFTWQEYGWRMTEYRYWGKCDGSRMPGDWPVIYRFKSPKKD